MRSQAEAAALPSPSLASADVSVSAPFCRETGRGAIYLAARYGLGVMVGVGNMLVMTWWIGPHAYGLFVTAVGIVAFLAIIARCGIDTYLVRSEAPDAGLYGTATTLILGASIGLGLAAAAATPLFIRWYGSSEFVPPYLALLMAIPVSALTGIPMAKLERGLEFRRIAGIELAGQSLGLVVAATLAWRHAGVWAPVMGQIAWQVFTLIAAAVCAAIPFRVCLERKHVRPMLSYGVALTASLRTWQLRTLVNPLIVGRFVGAEGVAYVALALRIAEALGSFRLAAGRMAIAALARLQHRRELFRRAIEQALYLQVVTLGPLLCAFALIGPYFVPHVIGVRWMPSLRIFPFAAAGVLVNSVYNLQASALFVVGKQWLVMRSYVVHVVLLAVTTYIFLPRLGLIGYGWAELVACSAYCLIHSGLAATVPISYQRLRPWVAGFVAGLFLVPVGYTLLRLN
ncbi:MAG: oligosaccharide flippase family protein [Terriglobales bacterium]